MFNEKELKRAVELQAKAYECLLWVSDNLRESYTYRNARKYASICLSPKEWVDAHYNSMPIAMRPATGDIPDFCNLLNSFFNISFNMVGPLKKPNWLLVCFYWFFRRVYHSPSRLRLERKTVSKEDQQVAKTMMMHELQYVADLLGVELQKGTVHELVNNKKLKGYIAICAYARDLLLRVQGEMNGTPVLALWRTFAWTSSPKKHFELTVPFIIDAQENVKQIILEAHQTEVAKMEKRQGKNRVPQNI